VARSLVLLLFLPPTMRYKLRYL